MGRCLRGFRAEFTKYWLEVRCYYPDQIVSVVVLFIMFMGFFSLGNHIKDPSYYIGFVFWFYASGIIGTSSVTISDEKQSGTFEQLLIKPTRLSTILLYRSVCWLILQTVEIIAVMSVIRILFRVPMGFSIGVIPVFLVTIAGLIGISYILSALTLIFTKTASFCSIFGYVLLFFTGIISGTNSVGKFSHYVLPLSQGIQISRQLILGETVLSEDVALLLFNSAAYLGIGLFIFRSVMKKAKTKGISQKY